MLLSERMRIAPVFFAYTDADGWHAGIGDPTAMGWFTVAAYAVAAILCGRAALEERGCSREKFVFWTALAGIMGVLAINKQLDLQTWLTFTMKRVAQAQGWYEERRVVQLVFILLIAGAGAYGFRRAYLLVRGHARELWLGLAGLFLTVGFVVIRAASFHHIDYFLKTDLAGIRMNWVLELSAIAVVGLAAWRALRRDGRGTAAAGSTRCVA